MRVYPLAWDNSTQETPGTMGVANSILRRTIGNRIVGKPASRMVHSLGLEQLSRAMSAYSGFVPDLVQFTVTDARGQRRRGKMAGRQGLDFVVTEVWQRGLDGYERPLPDFFAAALRKNPAAAVLDVGANSGLYAVIAGLIADGPIHAFEPFPPARQALEHNLQINGLSQRVTVIPNAVGSETGTARLFVPVPKFGETLEQSASLREDFRPDHGEILDVPVVTIDDYVQSQGIGDIGVMLVDVEGFEHAVIQGSLRTMREKRPLVFAEVLEICRVDEIDATCKAADYRPVALGTDNIRQQSRLHAIEGMQNQLLMPAEKRDLVAQLAEELKVPAHFG
jgi:FkbM family methyltransferase